MPDYIGTIAKVVGVTNAGIFAGYTWSLGRACLPSILHYGTRTEASILTQWRNQYVDGSRMARPCCLISALTFGYLAYIEHSDFSTRLLFIIAAVLNASGVPYALTFLRRTNGALSIRAKRLAGSYQQAGGEPIACTYASSEARSIEREKDSAWTTERLIERWTWHNDLRTVVLILGTAIAAYTSMTNTQV